MRNKLSVYILYTRTNDFNIQSKDNIHYYLENRFRNAEGTYFTSARFPYFHTTNITKHEHLPPPCKNHQSVYIYHNESSSYFKKEKT